MSDDGVKGWRTKPAWEIEHEKKYGPLLISGDYHDGPTCPHCEFQVDPVKHEKYDLLGNAGDDVEITCPGCDKQFSVRVHVRIKYESFPMEAQ